LLSLKIIQEVVSEGDYNEYNNDEQYLFKKVFATENKLETFEYLFASFGQKIYDIDHSGFTFNFESLKLNVISFTDTFSIIESLTNLKYLNLILQSLGMKKV
jgi:dihydroorotase